MELQKANYIGLRKKSPQLQIPNISNFMDSNNTRSFICIDFPSEVIKEVARVQALINKKPFSGKLTELENLHITLKFLGVVDKEKLDRIKNKLLDINFSTLNLRLSKVGTFNYKGNPRIAWIKVKGNIFKLQETIDKSLSNLFQKEERFMSHLTIARIKYVKDKKSFVNYISNIKPKKLKFSVNEFKLKSSELKPEGPIYTTLETYKLG